MAEEFLPETSADERRRHVVDYVMHRGRISSKTGDEMRRLLLELELHQVELELQNEALREAHARLEASQREFYDLAPVGYFTLRSDGCVEKCNTRGVELLGQTPGTVIECRFAGYIAPESRPCFDALFLRARAHQEKASGILTLIKDGMAPIIIYLEATPVDGSESCQLVVVDITAAEEAKRRAEPPGLC